MSTKPVKLPIEVVNQLQEIKDALNLKSLGEASKFLTDISFSPIGMIALAYDLRADIKQLLEETKKLNENLQKLLEKQLLEETKKLNENLQKLLERLPKEGE